MKKEEPWPTESCGYDFAAGGHATNSGCYYLATNRILSCDRMRCAGWPKSLKQSSFAKSLRSWPSWCHYSNTRCCCHRLLPPKSRRSHYLWGHSPICLLHSQCWLTFCFYLRQFLRQWKGLRQRLNRKTDVMKRTYLQSSTIAGLTVEWGKPCWALFHNLMKITQYIA